MSASTHGEINHTEIPRMTPILNAHTWEKSTTPQWPFTAETSLTTSSKSAILTWSNLLTTPKEPLTNTSLRSTNHITTQLTTSNRTQSAKLTKAHVSSQTTNIYPQTITERSTDVKKKVPQKVGKLTKLCLETTTASPIKTHTTIQITSLPKHTQPKMQRITHTTNDTI
uniref:Uncharacterized protein n=1 Tax=Human herpesvirus 6B TaxID=32604 RepID=A0A2L2QE94_HHV6H|nr:hypothetical protein [Human betaherpesvirus 6B]